MLFDPKWTSPSGTKPRLAELLSLPKFIAWLEQQPADRTYCYGDGGRCLLATYFHQNGRPNASFGGTFYSLTNAGPNRNLPLPFRRISLNLPHTYGAALQRARSER